MNLSDIIQEKRTKTLMLISGAFVTNECWDGWQSYFEQKGYTVILPAWPYKDGKVSALRSQFKKVIPAQYDLQYIVDYHADIIDTFTEKPILIGHSFGGLIVQLLLQQNKAAAGVAYHSVPARGVFIYKFSFLKALWGPLGIFEPEKKPFLMSFPQWQYAFANGMTPAIQKETYDKLVVPETRRVLRAALRKTGKVDFSKAHAPLLFVSGTTDNIIPASLNRKNFERYKKNEPFGSKTHYKEFEGRNHLAMSQPYWKEDADYIWQWIRDF